MLPFMKAKVASAVTNAETMPKEDNEASHPGMLAAAEDLIRAIHAKDIEAAASALHSAFQIADFMPHEEGEHE